jgi:hypothetical protein
LERALGGVSAGPMPPGLHEGLAGVGWALAHLEGRIFDETEDLGMAQLDAELAQALAEANAEGLSWPHGYDLISGLVGIGVYGLERRSCSDARRAAELVVQALETSSEKQASGITWFTPPALVPPTQKDRYPDGYYNYGVAHGIPAVIAFLGRAYAAGVETATAGNLLEGAVSWLLATENPRDWHSRFPTFGTQGATTPTPSRMAWCYGDPGIAAALYCAARCTGQARWEREAIRVAIDAAHRPVEHHGLVDGGLCHGAAGLV